MPSGCAAFVGLHAGDMTSAAFAERVRAATPAWFVRGNNDTTLDALPERIERRSGGIRLAMVHDSGQRKGCRERVRAWFTQARVVVFGHSHIPPHADVHDGDPRHRRPDRRVDHLGLEPA